MRESLRADVKVSKRNDGGWAVSINDQGVSFWLAADDGFRLTFEPDEAGASRPVVTLKLFPTDLDIDLPDVLTRLSVDAA